MIGIIKADARYNYLHKLIDNSILSNDVLDFYNVDVLILPFKGIDEDGYIYGTKIKLAEILKNNCIKRIIVGNANNILKELCDKDIEIIELLKKDDFIKDNAFLTAKGCINYISNGASDISEFKILILGFGYI